MLARWHLQFTGDGFYPAVNDLSVTAQIHKRRRMKRDDDARTMMVAEEDSKRGSSKSTANAPPQSYWRCLVIAATLNASRLRKRQPAQRFQRAAAPCNSRFSTGSNSAAAPAGQPSPLACCREQVRLHFAVASGSFVAARASTSANLPACGQVEANRSSGCEAPARKPGSGRGHHYGNRRALIM